MVTLFALAPRDQDVDLSLRDATVLSSAGLVKKSLWKQINIHLIFPARNAYIMIVLANQFKSCFRAILG